MTTRDHATGRFTAERTTTTVTERVTIEPAPGPLLPEAQARLAAPLPYPSPPVIFTPAMRAAADEWQDEYRTDWGPEGIKEFNDASEALGCQRTYGPCISRELAMASAPQRLPSERLFPAMMP